MIYFFRSNLTDITIFIFQLHPSQAQCSLRVFLLHICMHSEYQQEAPESKAFKFSLSSPSCYFPEEQHSLFNISHPLCTLLLRLTWFGCITAVFLLCLSLISLIIRKENVRSQKCNAKWDQGLQSAKVSSSPFTVSCEHSPCFGDLSSRLQKVP